MNYLTEFEIQQLRTKNLITAVESIAVVVGAIIANMLIPQLLLQYVYTDTSNMLQAPAIFTYLPLVTYSIAFLYFVYAMISNFIRGRKAAILEKELYLADGCSCCDGSCDCNDSCGCNGECDCEGCTTDGEISDKELKELEKIVDNALKTTKNKSAKKVTKTAEESKKKSTKKSK